MIQQSIKKEIEESILTKQLLIENGLNYIEEAAGLLIDAIKTSKKILDEDKVFFSKKDNLKLLEDLEIFFGGQIKKGIEIQKSIKIKNLYSKVERLRRNGCIKLDKIKKEKSSRSVARNISVLRTFIDFLSKSNKWENHAINKIESSKYISRTDDKVFEEQDIIEFLNFIDPDIQSKNINDKFFSWEHRRDLAILYFLYSSLVFKLFSFTLKIFSNFSLRPFKDSFIRVWFVSMSLSEIFGKIGFDGKGL